MSGMLEAVQLTDKFDRGTLFSRILGSVGAVTLIAVGTAYPACKPLSRGVLHL